MSVMVDETGKRYGTLTVIGRALPMNTMDTNAWWTVRCDCGETWARCGAELRARAKQAKRGGMGCRRCAARSTAQYGPAGHVSWAKRGWCSWCPDKKAERWPHECNACNRAASRNGRDATGRPVRIGNVEGARRAHATLAARRAEKARAS